MSADLDRATTRNFLDGLRSFVTTFDEQRDVAREQDALALTESREHHPHAILFGDLLPRLQTYSLVTLLTVVLKARLAVFCKAVHQDHGLDKTLDDMDGTFLERVHIYLRDVVQAEPPVDLWRWAEELVLLHACIVDSAGNPDLMNKFDRRVLQQIVRRRPGLALEHDDLLFSRSPHLSQRSQPVLVIDTEFCMEAVTAAQGLFGYLYQHRTPGGP
ncbi:MAG: hypothetical protein JSW51_08830 [Gemmatimonadota bacterium]|nr:MAG: hypothetical protein JSW51_08830 [Gemmatimonadota bacterium]